MMTNYFFYFNLRLLEFQILTLYFESFLTVPSPFFNLRQLFTKMRFLFEISVSAEAKL